MTSGTKSTVLVLCTVGLIMVGLLVVAWLSGRSASLEYQASVLLRRTDYGAISAATAGMSALGEKALLAAVRREILVPVQLVEALRRPEVIETLTDPDVVSLLSRDWDAMDPESRIHVMDELADALADLRSRITVTFAAQTDAMQIIKLTVSDPDPVRARVLANAIAVSYEEYHRKALESVQKEAARSYDDEIEELEETLRKADEDIADFRREKSASLSEPERAVLKRREELSSEVARIRAALFEARHAGRTRSSERSSSLEHERSLETKLETLLEQCHQIDMQTNSLSVETLGYLRKLKTRDIYARTLEVQKGLQDMAMRHTKEGVEVKIFSPAQLPSRPVRVLRKRHSDKNDM